MSDYAWISILPLNPDRGLWMDCEPVSGDRQFPHSFQNRNNSGEALGPECFPKIQWAAGDREAKRIPDVFQGASGFILSKHAADVFRGFNLGQGNLYPVILHRRDRSTPYEGEYSFLNIGNVKTAFIPTESPRVRRSSDGKWVPPGSLADDDFAIARTAAEQAPDVWADTALNDCFFLSRPLGDALQSKKLGKQFWLRTCRLVDA